MRCVLPAVEYLITVFSDFPVVPARNRSISELGMTGYYSRCFNSSSQTKKTRIIDVDSIISDPLLPFQINQYTKRTFLPNTSRSGIQPS